jgi:hypothetical protein
MGERQEVNTILLKTLITKDSKSIMVSGHSLKNE